MTSTSKSSTTSKSLNLAAEAKALQKRNYVDSGRFLHTHLGDEGYQELLEVLRDDTVQLVSLVTVLKNRGIDMSYSALLRFRNKVRNA